MDEQGYNGWKNYETWNVNLWLDNDEPMYRDVVAMTRRALVANTPEEAAEELAPQIREYVNSVGRYTYDRGDRRFFGDLETREELDRVDWLEIAEAWVDAYRDDQ